MSVFASISDNFLCINSHKCNYWSEVVDIYKALEMHCQVLWQGSLPCTLASTGGYCDVSKYTVSRGFKCLCTDPKTVSVFSSRNHCLSPDSAIIHCLCLFDCVSHAKEEKRYMKKEKKGKSELGMNEEFR